MYKRCGIHGRIMEKIGEGAMAGAYFARPVFRLRFQTNVKKCAWVLALCEKRHDTFV